MIEIEVKRDSKTNEWIVTIPIDYWDEFSEYAQEIRLSYRCISTAREGITIGVPDGYSGSDVEEIIGFFFDDIADVVVRS